RQLRRMDDQVSSALRELLRSRTRHLWRTSTPSERRGWYRAGVGAEAGSQLGAASERIVELAIAAEVALFTEDYESAAERIVALVETVFAVDTFRPERRLDDWRTVVRQWVSGRALGELPGDHVAVAAFVESDLIYKV